ncbi:hypothetical protein [Pseudarthrobacter sp. H2]|uniref:hypothetical protein n=1 Tax=Pseudarthrobacter sp. H2 TaxID=3418415 RepID=UPI003CF10708
MAARTAPTQASQAQTPQEPAEVTATAAGPWPGEDPVEATRTVRGELGSPHLPFLAELPDRGVGSDALGRTASLLVDMSVDVQPYGWRIVDRPGKDLMRARSALSTDINILADLIGAEDTPAADIKVQLRGPLSLAAGLHLHHGERALIDYGARRDIAASLAAGVDGYLSRVAIAAPGARIVVQIDEPEIASVLAGTIPTSSGYRTLRSIPGQEITDSWRLVIDALRAAGAAEIVVSVAEVEAPFDRILAAGADGIAVPLRALTSRQWEQLAGAVEAGKRLWAGALDVADPAARLPRVGDVVENVWRPWRQLGLPASTLGALRITPSDGLAHHSPSSATAVLTRLTQVADGLNQLALG